MRKSSSRTAWTPFKRYWWVSIPAFLLSLGGAAAYLALSPELYEASVRLSVEDERTSVSDIGQTITEADEIGGANPIVTQAEVVKSQGVLRAALEIYRERSDLASSSQARVQQAIAAGRLSSSTLGNAILSESESPGGSLRALGPVAQEEDSRDRTENAPSVESLMQELQVSIIPATSLLEVSYRDEDPRQSAAIVNAVAQAAVAENVEAINVEASAVREFLESQLPSLQSRLQQAELAESQYRETSGLLAVDAQNQQMVGGLAALEQEKRSLVSALEEVSTRERRLQDVTGISSPETAYAMSRIGQDPQLLTLQSQLTSTRVSLTEAQSKLGDIHPELLAIQDELTGLQSLYQQRLAQLTPAGFSQSFSNEAANLSANDLSQQLMAEAITSSIEEEALRNRLAVVESNLGQMQNQFTEQPSLQRPLTVLSRERQDAEDSLKLIKTKLEEARIAESQLVSNVRVVGAAEPPQNPVSPKPFAVLALGAVAGAILSVASILLLDLLDVSLQSGEEVEKLVKLPVLGYLPRLSADLVDIEGLDAFLDNPRHVEPYRALLKTMASRQRSRTLSASNLQANLSSNLPGEATTASTAAELNPSQVVVVSSPTNHEGKSSVATCLGAVSAMLGRKTLIIEADPHHPIQHLYLQVESQPGLTDAINRRQPLSEVVKLTTIGRLSLLPYGSALNRPSTVTESSSMRLLLNALKREYDLILIDTASVDTSADAATVSQMTDGLLLVTRPGYTPRSVLADTVQQLRKSGAPLLGIAMNETILPEEQLGRLPSSVPRTAVTNRS